MRRKKKEALGHTATGATVPLRKDGSVWAGSSSSSSWSWTGTTPATGIKTTTLTSPFWIFHLPWPPLLLPCSACTRPSCGRPTSLPTSTTGERTTTERWTMRLPSFCALVWMLAVSCRPSFCSTPLSSCSVSDCYCYARLTWNRIPRKCNPGVSFSGSVPLGVTLLEFDYTLTKGRCF